MNQGHRVFLGEGWKTPGLWVAFGFPGLCFALFVAFNLCLRGPQE